MSKKIVIYVVLLGILIFGLTGCKGNSSSNENQEDETRKEGQVIIDDEYITISYIQREFKKIPGMLDNKQTTFNLPTVLLNITNKCDEKIHFEVHTSKTIDSSIDYSFALTNENRKIDSSGTVLQAKEKQDVNVIYQRIRNLKTEYPLNVFNDKIIYLNLYKYGTEGQTVLVKEYEINASNLR